MSKNNIFNIVNNMNLENYTDELSAGLDLLMDKLNIPKPIIDFGVFPKMKKVEYNKIYKKIKQDIKKEYPDKFFIIEKRFKNDKIYIRYGIKDIELMIHNYKFVNLKRAIDLNLLSLNVECGICFENILKGKVCPVCYYNTCADCYKKLENDFEFIVCPCCRFGEEQNKKIEEQKDKLCEDITNKILNSRDFLRYYVKEKYGVILNEDIN